MHCVIDWAALGTWAAVVVALGIALHDTFRRRRAERFERKAVAEMLRAELDRLGVAAADLQKAARKYVGPMDLPTILKTDVSGFPREIVPFLARLSAPAWEILISRAPVVGADAAGKLVTAFSSFALLRTLAEATAHKEKGTEGDAEMIREFTGMAIASAKEASEACHKVPAIKRG